MKKKLLMAAAIAFAVFAIPYGSSTLSTVSVASENNTVATPVPVPTPTPAPATIEEVKDAVLAIDPSQITNDNSGSLITDLSNMGKENLKNAMNGDSEMISQIAKIEEACKKLWGYKDAKIDNSTSVEAVGIIGTAFSGNEVTLSVEAPATQPQIASTAYNVTGDPVYVEINLKVRDYTIASLTTPVAITIKTPAGVDGSKAVIFHFVDGKIEEIKPIYDAAANTLTFCVDHFSTFAIAEAESTATAGSCGGTDDAFGRYRDNLTSEIANAKDGTTVKITRDKNINALPNDIMKALYKKQTVALELEYTFEGNEYTVTIPAGQAEDNAIEWYGPLYLQMRYGK